MTKRSTAVELDVHKDSIDVSIAEEGAPGRCVTTEGEIPSDRFDTLIERLRRHGGQVRLVYEAVRAASRCIAIGAVGESTARRCLLSWAGDQEAAHAALPANRVRLVGVVLGERFEGVSRIAMASRACSSAYHGTGPFSSK